MWLSSTPCHFRKNAVTPLAAPSQLGIDLPVSFENLLENRSWWILIGSTRRKSLVKAVIYRLE
jgi:hypothetical protein